VRHRLRIDAASVDLAVRPTMVFDERARVIVYADAAVGIEGAMGPIRVNQTIMVARPLSVA
jgi:hypothetical protein